MLAASCSSDRSSQARAGAAAKVAATVTVATIAPARLAQAARLLSRSDDTIGVEEAQQHVDDASCRGAVPQCRAARRARVCLAEQPRNFQDPLGSETMVYPRW